MKIVILGGGIAGCSAAYLLKQKGIDDITLIEKGNIGGCCRTYHSKGIPYEFGPQILYTKEKYIQDIFERFVTNEEPYTDDLKYHPALSIDGRLDIIYDFPVSLDNVIKLEDSKKVINELYHINLDKPDYSDFENYVISRVGPTLYELFFKNYNIKMWKMHPSEMDAEWAKFRNMSLKEKSDMFGDAWQGHPGNHNPIFDGMLNGINVEKGICKIVDNKAYVDDSEINADLIVSTIPLSEKLPFVNLDIIYVLVKDDYVIMPSYTTSFPNNYNFTRIIEYKQQYYVESEYTLLSFEFPFIHERLPYSKQLEEVSYFVNGLLDRDIENYWRRTKYNLYPISGKDNIRTVKVKLNEFVKTNIFPLGRMGIYAYVSKDTCVHMANILANNLDKLESDKLNLMYKVRERLS